MTRQVYEIDTPENVRFRFERAGLASRALAWTVDVAAMALLLQLGALIAVPFELVVGEAADALWLVIGFLVQWWYGALAEWRFGGRTAGKWLLGLAARDDRGLRLTLYQAAIRNLLRIVDLLPGLYLVGGVTSLLDPHGRRLGDLAASTLVVRTRTGAIPARALADIQEDLSRYPAFGDASKRLNPYERDAVLGLCGERDKLPIGLRLALFAELAGHLERRLGLSRPAHLSAEKVILYLGAALAAPSKAARA